MRTLSASLALGAMLSAIGCTGEPGEKSRTPVPEDTGTTGTTDTDEPPVDPLMVDDDGDGYSEHRGDCDDTNPLVYPRATERCNGIDDDCDTKIDDDDIDVQGQPSWWLDSDGDGYGTELEQLYACEDPGGYADNPLDCDDSNAEVHPDTVWYIDTDFDGYGSDSATRTACEQPGGYTAAPDDCDDTNGEVNPAADELCDGIDNDCDGLTDDEDDTIVDETGGVTFYEDSDGDGYGVESELTAFGCEVPPAGFADNTDDCNDDEGSINPGATEVWYDGIDSDCGEDNDYDADADGYDSIDYAGTDCDDAEAQVNPGMAEVCNDDLDNDCSGDAPECAPAALNSTLEQIAAVGIDTDFASASSLSGDVDGDGINDVLIGASGDGSAYLYFGAITGSYLEADADGTITDSVSSGAVGEAVTFVPDLNGDGYDELLLGCDDCDPLATGDAYGAAWLMYGPFTGGAQDVSSADATWRGATVGGELGSAFHTMSDFDGDTISDFLLGEPSQSTAYLVLGTVTASGDASTAATATFTAAADDQLGSVMDAADFDGDGVVDMAFGIPGYDSSFTGTSGGVYVVYGPQSGSVDVTTSYTAKLTYSTSTAADYGSALSAGGDLDGDGTTDLAVGAPAWGEGGGAVYVHFGAISGAMDPASADLTVTSATGNASGLGNNVHLGGDFNRDGHDDLIITSGSADVGGSLGIGSVGLYVYYGPFTATSLTTDDADLELTDQGTYDEQGALSVDDANGDGTDDILWGLSHPGEAGSNHLLHWGSGM